MPTAGTIIPASPSELQALQPQAKSMPYHVDNNLEAWPANVIKDVPNVSIAASADISREPAEQNQLVIHGLPYKPTVSLAVLGGYEKGFSDLVQNRVSAALRVMLQVSERFGIGLQPAYRFGNLTTTSISEDAFYQRSTVTIDSFHTFDASPSVRGGVDT